MNGRWLAVVLAWLSGAVAIVGTAVAWGSQGRGTTLALGIVLALALFLSTAMVAQHEKGNDG